MKIPAIKISHLSKILVLPSYTSPSDDYTSPSDNYKFPSDNYKFPSDNYKFPSDDYKFPSDDYKFPSDDYKFPSDNYKFPSDNYKFPSDDYKFPSDNYKFPSDDYKFPSDDYKFPSDDYDFGEGWAVVHQFSADEISKGCYGLCGPWCTCWSQLCGDCCWHPGCYQHDKYCDKPKSLSCKLGRGVTFGRKGLHTC